MKTTSYSLLVAFGVATFAGGAQAQLQQPTLATPVAMSYTYYAQDADPGQAAPSPSDVPLPVVQDEMVLADEPEVAADVFECEEDDGPVRLFNKTCSGIEIGGWFEASYYANNSGNNNNDANAPIPFAGDVSPLAFNQAWLYAEKAIDTDSCCYDWGFRVDYLWGADSNNTDAFGDQSAWDYRWDTNEFYGSALPQAYLQFGNSDWNVKVGHFYTIIGYEVVGAPNNFFYTHAYTMNYGEPFTHTGFLFEKSACCDQVTLWAGWSNSWDSYFGNYLDGSTFLGGASVALSDSQTLTWACTFGDFGDGTPRGSNNPTDGTSGDVYMQSIVYDWNVNECMEYVFQSDYGRNWNRAAAQEPVEWYGVNQYLFYTLTSCHKLGLRVEWFDDVDGGRVGAGPTEYWSYTAGVNYSPNANVIIRPEIRYDRATNATPYNNGTDSDQLYYGADIIVQF